MADYYTFQGAHFRNIDVKVGDVLHRGDKIGNQGYTGYVEPPGPDGEHLHYSVVHGWIRESWTLDEAVPGGRLEPSKSQMDLFYGSDLYDPSADPTDKSKIMMGTYGYGGYRNHYALDVLKRASGAGPAIYWNRSMPGTVTAVVHHTGGKGNHVLIAYDGDYEAPKGTVGTVNYESVYLRSKPELDAPSAGMVYKGNRVTVVDTVRDSRKMLWYKLASGVYIKSDFISF